MSSDSNDAFDQIHGLSISDPDQFWGNAAEEIHWYTITFVKITRIITSQNLRIRVTDSQGHPTIIS